MEKFNEIENKNKVDITTFELPLLALRGMTIFPSMLVHFDVGREKSIQALEEAMNGGRHIFLVAQKHVQIDNPKPADLYGMGTISIVRQMLKVPGEAVVRVLVEGVTRAKLLEVTSEEPGLRAIVKPIPEPEHKVNTARVEAMIRRSYELFEKYLNLVPKPAPEVAANVISSTDPAYIADYIAQNIMVRYHEKQEILETVNPYKRISHINSVLEREIEILSIEQNIAERVQEQVNRNQKEYMLREQIKAIQAELGEGEDVYEEMEVFRRKIRALNLDEELEEKLLKEITRLSKQPFGSAEAAVLRNYIETCIELPWNKESKDKLSVEVTERALNADHYGLDKVKERILEIIAVKKLAPNLGGQIVCLAGPPGVGKTSIAMSIGRAMGRKVQRISLGGVRDEADIRGHRKTYIGAMPGRIMTAIRQAGVKNPILVLDEIDKLGMSNNGDPASALLEVLDTEQNHAFRDHFIELPFDLSKVMFITTANTTSTIPRPLLDRMEVIELPSYTDEEKLQIAKKHLVPKQIKRHGLNRSQLRITDDALREIAASYTRESGVRILEREIARICRRAAKKIVTGEAEKIKVNAANLEEYLGVRKFAPEKIDKALEVGVVNGLAWTEVGGELLEVECNVVPGSGKLELTGNLGQVMQESVKAAVTFIRSRCNMWNIDPEFYKNKDIHIHFPEGAVPKDGPSAGIAITTAIVSALTDAPVRRTIAMTGEITLRGRVLPIGGLREKTMAALRNGINTVIIPKENEKDLKDIDPLVRNALEFVTVETADAVIETAIDFTAKKPIIEEREHTQPEFILSPEGKTGNGSAAMRQ